MSTPYLIAHFENVYIPDLHNVINDEEAKNGIPIATVDSLEEGRIAVIGPVQTIMHIIGHMAALNCPALRTAERLESYIKPETW